MQSKACKNQLLHGELMQVHVLLRDFISVWISNVCIFLISVLTKIPAVNSYTTLILSDRSALTRFTIKSNK